MLEIPNNGPYLHCHGSSKVSQNLPNPTTHSMINSFKKANEKNYTMKSNNFIGQLFFVICNYNYICK